MAYLAWMLAAYYVTNKRAYLRCNCENAKIIEDYNTRSREYKIVNDQLIKLLLMPLSLWLY